MLSALLTLSALAAPPAAVIEAPSAADMPAEDGLWLWRNTTVSQREGGLTVQQDQALKVFTARLDREGLLDPRLSWDAAASELEVDQARCWLADGTEVVARDNSIVPNTPGALQWAVPYASQRELVVAQVGVEHGGTCQLAWRVSHAPTELPAWGMVPLALARPVSELSVSVDVGEALRWSTVDELGSGEPHQGETLSMSLSDVAAHDPAEGWPAPRLVWSSVETWDAARQVLRARIDPAVQPKAVKAAAQGVLSPSMLGEARVAALHSLVAEGVRTVDWPVSAFGYQARPAAEVLDSSVGHPLDKAVLLVSLLRADGIEADIALASSRRELAWEVPNPDQLDQVWVVVEGERWLDPTGRRDQWEVEGQPVWLLSGQGGALRLPGGGQSVASVRWELELSWEDEAIAASGTGMVQQTRAYHPGPDLDLEAGLSTSIPAPSGATVGEVDVLRLSSEVFVVQAELEGGRLEVVGEHGLAMLEPPRTPSVLAGLQTWREHRAHPVRLPPAREVVEVVLHLDGVEAVGLPEATDLSAPGARFVRAVEVENDLVTITESLELQEMLVSSEQWPEVRAVLTAAEASQQRSVSLKTEE